jgi:AcrR family transcriptional regulator
MERSILAAHFLERHLLEVEREHAGLLLYWVNSRVHRHFDSPAHTTVKAIAERARVQRLTVYRHFPDEIAKLTACSSHWAQENPPPRSSSWNETDDPQRCLRLALDTFYTYYASEERMITNSIRDAPLIPFVAQQLQRYEGYLDKVRVELQRNWKARGKAGGNLANLLAHALRFETWRSLSGRDSAPRRPPS